MGLEICDVLLVMYWLVSQVEIVNGKFYQNLVKLMSNTIVHPFYGIIDYHIALQDILKMKSGQWQL